MIENTVQLNLRFVAEFPITPVVWLKFERNFSNPSSGLGGYDESGEMEDSSFRYLANRFLLAPNRVNSELIGIHGRATEWGQPDPSVPQTERS